MEGYKSMTTRTKLLRFGAASLTARLTAWLAGGYVVQSEMPCLPPGRRYYEITVDGPAVHGQLYEI